ncbi:MAG TPA: sirohydrochlorin chelatase [Candidatus Dormibacteraeota bacterium]|jgi:sirohydrochlorin ferrochelatase|nr:sirohydrochlorin chelatase [Candidatus Dormibacteraeota bacterium]
MKTAVLLIGHGSPDREAQEELLELRDLVAQELGRPVLLGVLEFPTDALPRLQEVLESPQARGSLIVAQPLLLFDGVHGRYDIPQLAAAAGLLGLEVRLGTPFGQDRRLVELYCRRISQLGVGRSDRLLFAGRGSSEARALAQADNVASAIARQAGLGWDVCFTGISDPDLAEGARTALSAKPDRLAVIPYLLHTGILVRRVRELIMPIARRAGTPLAVLPHLGNEPEVIEVIVDRIKAMLPNDSVKAVDLLLGSTVARRLAPIVAES